MDKFEFYKELYHKENERRLTIEQGDLSIPIAIVTALSTALFFLFTTFNYQINFILTSFFLIGISSLVITLSLAIYNIIKAFGGLSNGQYEYEGLSYPNALETWYKDLEKYYADDKDSNVSQIFKEHLLSSIIAHTSYNMETNDKKKGFIHQSKRYIILGLIITIFSIVPYSINYFMKSPKNINAVETNVIKDNKCKN